VLTEVTVRPAVRHAPLAGLVVLLSLLLVSCGRTSSTGDRSPTPPVGPAATLSAQPAPPPTPPTSGPARIVQARNVAGRTWDVTIHSPAVGAAVPVRLLLPVRFDREPRRNWPVLYLLHGCCDSYLSWTRSTDIDQLTSGSDVLVVMPDAGPAGFYSNWLDGPQWETFHLIELPTLLAKHYRAGTPQAIAGVSMGGLGALGYAARHPGTFTVAGSFSGIVDTRLSDEESQAYRGLVQSQSEDPDRLWGDPTTHQEVWQAHNPIDLAPQLEGTRLFVSAGNGQPGPLDPPGTSADETETAIGAENAAFVQQIKVLHLDAQVDLYGDGTHTWVYWQRELHRAWPLLRRGLGQ
jgi:diacylglycerol O-acyltransferase/trehalose O-mycolyltransferase